MKIAILSLPLGSNYGGLLQAYALQTVLQRMGHTVEVCQKIPTSSHSKWIMSLVYVKRIWTKLFKNKHIHILDSQFRKEREIISQNTSKFIDKYFNLKHLKFPSNIGRNDYDAIIVGSDQVWRTRYFKTLWLSNIQDAFLGFTKGWDIKRIAYAASFGTDNLKEYTEKEIQLCREALARFCAVSVRESSGITICENKFGKEAVHVLDPTMLLSKEDYISLVKASNVPESPGDLLCYILDPTHFKEEIINKIARDKGLTPFHTCAQEDNYALPLEQRIQPPLEQWLRGFMDAKYVVTDSFHACVFSIIFNKPFLAIGNAKRGLARFNSLLFQFNLQDRLIFEGDTFAEVGQSTLDRTESLLNNLRESSMQFLYKALN